MKGSGVNSSASDYFWKECNTYDDVAGKLGGPSAGLLILLTTYCFEFLVGAPSNFWLICHILRKRSKVAGVLPADFFPFHLALIHLLFCLVILPFVANHYLWQSNTVLVVGTFLNAMVLIMKPLLLCLVCVERYMAVVRPLDYLRFKAHQYRWGCLGLSWCIYVIMVSTLFTQNLSYIVCVLFLPVLVIDTFCCLSVLKALQKPPPGDKKMIEKSKKKKKGEDMKKTHKNGVQVVRVEEGKQEQSRRKEERKEEKGKKGEKSQLKGKGEMNFMKKKAFITITIIQAVLTFNYLPFIITLPVGRLVPTRTFKCQYMAMALAAAASCSYLQPLLYLYRLGRLPCMMSQNT